MRAPSLILGACVWALGCGRAAPAATEAPIETAAQAPAKTVTAAPEAPAETAHEGAPEPTASGAAATDERAERAFGAPLSEREPVAVSALLDDPTPYLGKVVKANGTVSRVCQKAGCWLELAAEPDGRGLRVPMANHAFFIPEDAIGRPAVVEGELTAQALPEDHKAHLASEGAEALGPLSLAATGVVIE